MGSTIRSGVHKANINNMQKHGALYDINLHMIKGLHENQASMETQLLNMTEAITSLIDNCK